MSASLVGSEMCIRDSLWGANEGSPTVILDADAVSIGTQGDMSFSYRAVSYTHLTLPTICSV
eukprot:12715575-Alexandrium_andersonii.AAC.1